MYGPSEGRSHLIKTPFLWKGEGPKGGGWLALADRKTSATSAYRGTHFAACNMFLQPASSQQLAARSFIDMYALALDTSFLIPTDFV